MIMLMFDANKVDISDEFKKVIVLLQEYEAKIRVVARRAIPAQAWRNSAQFSLIASHSPRR